MEKHDFIGKILAAKDAAPKDRFVRYVSPKTGEMKQVYFRWVEDVDWIICSSAWEHEMYAPIGRILWLVIGILTVSFLVIVLVTISASRRVGTALGNIADGLKKVGEGDLTTQIPHDTWSFETEQATRQLNEAVVTQMRSAVNHIKHSVNESYEIKNDLAAAGEQTGSAIHQISANIQSIRERTEHLRDSIKTNTSSVQNITTDIGEVAGQINEQSAMIEESTASVNEMLSSLISVADITRQRKEATAHLTESSQKASQKLDEANTVFYEGVASKIDSIQEAAGTIQKIAAQTNMLAMNAAIEAAHAGEAGYGFAVVADEIRKLAEISSKSSSDITATIKDVVKNIEHSRTTYSEAGKAFAGTYDETRQTAEAFSEIEASTQELSGAGKQILTAMTSLQETSATIQDRITSTKSSIEQILRSQNRIENISSENTNGIQEINTGIGEINDAMQMVTKLNTKLGDAINELEEGIRIFRTESQTEFVDEETGVTLHDEDEPAGG